MIGRYPAGVEKIPLTAPRCRYGISVAAGTFAPALSSGIKMADRSMNSFLRLPFFDDQFRKGLADLSLDRVEFWLAMSGDDDQPAEDQISELLPALTDDQDKIDVILNRLGMVQILSSVICRSADKVQQEIATDLGYGSAELKMSGVKRAAPSEDPEDEAPAQVVGAMPGGRGPQGEITSIQAQEQAERQKWGLRLQAIAARAGEAAKINDPSRAIGLPPAEALRLRAMGFEAGGFRTIRMHVRAWEKMEEWTTQANLRTYPPSIMAVMRYCLHLQASGCGPAVLPALKHSIGWICKRLIMTCPDLNDPHLVAVIDRVHQEKGKELKEAIPLPGKIVMAMEIHMDTLRRKDKIPGMLFVWWTLILIYSSLRFDDGVHVAPISLQLTDDGLFGVVWQTKVDRKRRGTRFAVPRCSLSGVDWLMLGWRAFQDYRADRDFFIWDLKDSKTFTKVPLSYSRGMAWLKFYLLEALHDACSCKAILANEAQELERVIPKITWHSMRVTFLSEAVKQGKDDKSIGLQANWKDPKELVLKYARQRKELSVAMVKDVAAKMRSAWTPDPENFVMEEEDQEVVEPIAVEYMIKSSLPAKALSSTDFRCHIYDQSVDDENSLCGRLKFSDAALVGRIPPCSVCKICASRQA